MRILELFKRFRRDEEGVTLVEYGVALILATVVGATALTTLGGDTSTQMGQVGAILQAN